MPKRRDKLITTFSEYELTEQIGQGGSATAWVAVSRSGEEVVVKVLRPEGVSSSFKRRFKNEIRFCQETNHTNVIKVLDHGVIVSNDAHVPFFVTARYAITLRNVMQLGPLPPEDALPIFSKIVDGVEAGHNEGTWHRDLKPENILLSEDLETVVVADWGIAHFSEKFLETAIETKDRDRLANFTYAAPEQRVLGQTNQIEPRLVDLFSLGLIMSELLTSEIPHGSGYRKVSDVHPEWEYLDDVVEGLIQHSPANRYQSIDELKKSLIAKKNEFFARQKLSQIEQTTVGRYDIDDEETENTFKVTGVDYQNGQLQLSLNSAPPRDWIQVFKSGAYSKAYLLGTGPENFDFRDNVASVSVRPQYTQQVTNNFKGYCESTTKLVMQEKARRAQQQKRQEEKELKRQAEAEAARIQVLQNLKY